MREDIMKKSKKQTGCFFEENANDGCGYVVHNKKAHFMKKKFKKTAFRDSVADLYPDTYLLFMDPVAYDEAIIGVAEGFGGLTKVAYDYDKVIQVNMKLGMKYEEAIEWFDYNQIGAYVGEHTPVFIRKYQIRKNKKGNIK